MARRSGSYVSPRFFIKQADHPLFIESRRPELNKILNTGRYRTLIKSKAARWKVFEKFPDLKDHMRSVVAQASIRRLIGGTLKIIPVFTRLPLREQEELARASHLANMLAKNLGFSQEARQVICASAAFSDIGKLAIPREIRTSTKAFTPGERLRMMPHVVVGAAELYDYYKGITSKKNARDIARNTLFHHEGIDEEGYFRLKDVSAESQIISITDRIDAIATLRPYSSHAFSIEECIEKVKSYRGQYDDIIIDRTLALLELDRLGMKGGFGINTDAKATSVRSDTVNYKEINERLKRQYIVENVDRAHGKLRGLD